MSQSTVRLCQGKSQFSYLVVSISSKSAVYVFSIDTLTGNIYYSGIPDVDLFNDTQTAIQKVTDSVPDRKWTFLGKYLIGASRFGDQLVIYTIVSEEATAFLLDFPIYNISSSNSAIIDIKGRSNPSIPITDFPLDHNHFFSIDLNLSLIFPFCDNRTEDQSFCWNNRWKEPFRRIEMDQVCVSIYQGAALSMYLDRDSSFNITYILKRSSLNPGTRYAARGLDDNANPANECECIIIFYHLKKYYWQYWRRGSAPVQWKTILSSSVSIPQHKVMEDPTVNTPLYFMNLRKKYLLDQVYVLSLLHEAPDKGEYDLLNAYKKGVYDTNQIADHFIEFQQFDINHVLRTNNSNETLTLISEIILPNIEKSGLATYDSQSKEIENQQKALFRINCADSLDRTNLVTFYYAIQIAKFFQSIFFGKSELSKEVVDFICLSFIKAGDIVSLIYTNTPAIKTGYIRQMMSVNTQGSSDAAITILRRFHNVASDPLRHRILSLWNDLSDANIPYLWLMPDFVSCVNNEMCDNINHNIFEENIFPTQIIPHQPILIRFSEQFILYKIRMYIYPIKNKTTITIKFGDSINDLKTLVEKIDIPCVSHRSFIKYNLSKILKSGSQNKNSSRLSFPGIFVEMTFHSIEPLYIGNISFCVQPSETFPPQITLSSDTISEKSFQAVIDSKRRSFGDLISVETLIHKNEITEEYRNVNIVMKNHNPVDFDLFSSLIPKNPKQCSICFCEILGYGQYEKMFENMNICSVCKALLRSCLVFLGPFEKYQKIRLQTRPTCHFVLNQFASFLSYPSGGIGNINGILKPPSDVWIPPNKCNPVRLTISLPYPVVLSEIRLLFDRNIDARIELELCSDKRINQKSNQKLFSFNPSISEEFKNIHLIQFSINIFPEQLDLIKFRFIEIIGSFSRPFVDIPKKIKPYKYHIPACTTYEHVWVPDHRYQFIVFPKILQINGVLFKLSTTSSKKSPFSLLFAFQHEEIVTVTFHLIIPKTEASVDIYYPFGNRVTCSRVIVYYIERTNGISPLQISFSTN